jgi:hypothetical protein
LREWDVLVVHGLNTWDPARERGVPEYDHPRESLRGGLDKYIVDLRNMPDGTPTPWKAFFLTWVKPQIEKQYTKAVAAEPKAAGTPGKQRSLCMVSALDRAVARMLEAAGVDPTGVTSRCACGTRADPTHALLHCGPPPLRRTVRPCDA